MSARSISGLPAEDRFQEHIRAWEVRVEKIENTFTSIIGFGSRDENPVVLKVLRSPGDEWYSGRTVEAFAGKRMVRALKYCPGAVLLEQLSPGHSLETGPAFDVEATSIVASVIAEFSPGPPPPETPTVELWGNAFRRYRDSGRSDIDGRLFDAAECIYRRMCASQADTRLLHGDLHHENLLFDRRRGWLAIDPKGVIGEPAYEVGAALRNPCQVPEVYADPKFIEKRVDCFARVLSLDSGRVLSWAFAQAILAAIWELEDKGVLQAGVGWIEFGRVVLQMLEPNRTS